MASWIRVEAIAAATSHVLLDRADRRNALNSELLEQLCETITELEQDPQQRVMILSGAGPVFSSGLDLREAADESLVERSAAAVQRALHKLQETSLVTIAAVQGGAYAGGAGLMAACDIVVAAADAKIGFPEARRGLLPALIYPALRRKLRDGDLSDLLLTGEPIDAQRAQQIGLVQRIAPPSQLMDEALRVARAVLAGGPATIRETKRLIASSSRQEGLSLEAQLQEHLAARRSVEAREGLAAFLEKREPNWE